MTVEKFELLALDQQTTSSELILVVVLFNLIKGDAGCFTQCYICFKYDPPEGKEKKRWLDSWNMVVSRCCHLCCCNHSAV